MPDLDFDARKGHVRLHGEPVIFHCNHYNAFLQRTILDPDYINCRDVLVDAAAAVSANEIAGMLNAQPAASPAERLAAAGALFAYCGFGLLDFSQTSAAGGVVTSPSSHYSAAWVGKFGPATEPMAFFDAGFISAAMSAAHGQPLGCYVVTQTACMSNGAPANQFAVSVDAARRVAANPAWPAGAVQAPPRSVTTTVDEDAIVAALASMPIAGNEQGLIPAFGVVLTRMAADYYNRISFEFEKRLEQATGDGTLGAMLLVEAGHSCAFNTFGGIMISAEWAGLIQPMCQTREDWVHGIVAAVNAFGWGVWRVEELVPGERLRVRIYGGYESNGYLAMYGASNTPKSHLATGGVAGIMNLLYHLDITTKPALTEELYAAEFSRPGSFTATQTACRAMGADYDEFVAVRS